MPQTTNEPGHCFGCAEPLGKRYYQDVPPGVDLCLPCHKKKDEILTGKPDFLERCSFCRAPTKDVGKLVVGPQVSICWDCIERSTKVVREEEEEERTRRQRFSNAMLYMRRFMSGIVLVAQFREAYGPAPVMVGELGLLEQRFWDTIEREEKE